MKINDTINVRSKIGKIIYIHPLNRWARIQYPDGKIETEYLVNPAKIAKYEKEYIPHLTRATSEQIDEQNIKITNMIEEKIPKKIIAECLDLAISTVERRIYKLYGTSNFKKVYQILTTSPLTQRTANL